MAFEQIILIVLFLIIVFFFITRLGNVTDKENEDHSISNTPVITEDTKPLIYKSQIEPTIDNNDAKNIERKKNIANEIVLNLKLLGICGIATIAFILIYYSANKPENNLNYTSDQRPFTSRTNSKWNEDSIESNTTELDSKKSSTGLSALEQAKKMRPSEAFRKFRPADIEYIGNQFENYSKYDEHIQTSSDIEDLHGFRVKIFNEDIKSKSIYFFLISIITLIFGRYILKAIKWLQKYSK